MSTIVPRYIIVDDVDPNIEYTGPWFPDQGSQDSAGNYGPPYQSTLHGTKANASLSFAFSGTHIKVIGATNIRNDSGVIDPAWQCFVDNISIGATPPFPFPENNWPFCEQSSLLDGPHILTVNATVMRNQTFWFDNIQYIPSASVSLDQAAIVVDSSDPKLQFGKGWGALGGTANMTTVAGTTFTYDFIGVSLGWYSYIPKELPITPSPATYSIDGETPINFMLKGLSSNATTFYNQKFFETPQLTAGPHTLKVVYQGNKSTPLTLDYLIVQNGTQSSTTTSASPHATSTTTGTGASGELTPGKSSTPVGAIVGGVIGGLVLIVLAVLGFLFLRRRKKRAAQDDVPISTPKPFDYTPLFPSSTRPNPSFLGDTSYSQSPQTRQMGNAVTYGAKGHGYHGSMPSLTSTDVSQSIQPPSTSSSSGGNSTNRRHIPFQQAALTLANPSLPSVPVPMSSAPSPPGLLTKAEREAEALATLRTQGRGNPPSLPSPQSSDAWSPDVVLHADSGIRMPPSTASRSIMDVPPIYTPD